MAGLIERFERSQARSRSYAQTQWDRRNAHEAAGTAVSSPRTEEELLQAYEEGQRAYEEGQASNNCPYRNIAMGDRWDAGWSNSKTDDPGA